MWSRWTSAWRPPEIPTAISRTCAKACSSMPARPEQIHAMPVESTDLEAAAERYAATLSRRSPASPAVLDLVHLGLGPDGHTASLVPGDPVLDVTDADVALTGVYQGRRRMTLTYPMLNRARRILWVVTGSEKADLLARLLRAMCRFPPAACVRTRRWCSPIASRGRISLRSA